MNPCGGLEAISLRSGRVACTHGADPREAFAHHRRRGGSEVESPQGDVLPDQPEGSGPSGTEGSAVKCYGDGLDGNRVQAIYARPEDNADRYEELSESIRRWAAETDHVFDASAAQYGQARHIRWVTDARCRLVIDHVVLSAASDDSFRDTVAELNALGYDRPDRKYLVWMDAEALCGIAEYRRDDRSSANTNNGIGPGMIARVDRGCWGLLRTGGTSVEAHELVHTLGGVAPTAPNATALAHCTDNGDIMCYQDAPLTVLRGVCPPDHDALLDCNGDDYYNPRPPTGSYIASHWNTANSSFLTGGEGMPGISVNDATVVERDTGKVTMIFTVTLDNSSDEGVSLHYRTVDGTARAGADYESTSGIVSFRPGVREQTVPVRVIPDTIDEADETLRLELSNAARGVLIDDEGAGVIRDDDPKAVGYWLAGADGGLFNYGAAGFYGSQAGKGTGASIVGIAATPAGVGYWLAGADGAVYPFGDAPDLSGTGSHPDGPVVGIASISGGYGYWLLTRSGTFFGFGDAGGQGSVSGFDPRCPPVGLATQAGSNGVWIVLADGSVIPVGAPELGSYHDDSCSVVGIASTPGGQGYWVADSKGTVHGFGDAPDLASPAVGGKRIVGIAATPSGLGYWLVSADGGIYAAGDARLLGDEGGHSLNDGVVGLASVPAGH